MSNETVQTELNFLAQNVNPDACKDHDVVHTDLALVRALEAVLEFVPHDYHAAIRTIIDGHLVNTVLVLRLNRQSDS